MDGKGKDNIFLTTINIPTSRQTQMSATYFCMGVDLFKQTLLKWKSHRSQKLQAILNSTTYRTQFYSIFTSYRKNTLISRWRCTCRTKRFTYCMVSLSLLMARVFLANHIHPPFSLHKLHRLDQTSLQTKPYLATITQKLDRRSNFHGTKKKLSGAGEGPKVEWCRREESTWNGRE